MTELMGHSHSSSHKRLRSISSSRNCAEFTEVVDLEFSDAGAFSEPACKLQENVSKSPGNNVTHRITNSNKLVREDNSRLDRVEEEHSEQLTAVKIQYPEDLLSLESHVQELEKSIEGMPSDEFFLYFPTLKDDLHNCWQKVYDVKEYNLETKFKKHKVIDNIRAMLRKLNVRLQRRGFNP